jgi:hypothetical protein
MRANKGSRYPADMDDLDRGYNNMRFLRHRYKEPMTGKDEWRIIHMQGGVLVDSLLNKPKEGDKKEDSTLGQNISAQAGLGETANAGQALPNAMNRRRPSEGGGLVAGGAAGAGTGGQPGQSAGQDNGTQPGDASGGTAQPGSSGAPGGPTSPFGGASGSTGSTGGTGQTGTAAGTGASDSGSSVGSYGSGLGGANPVSNVPGLPGSQNAANNQAQNTAAADMINKMMMGPRPGGMPGSIQSSATPNGMAGVASTVDSDGLMLYGDRKNYKEWEFVYDPTKDRPRQDPRNMLVGNQMGTPSGSTSGAATTSTQAGAFSQTGQTMTGAMTGANAQTGTSGQLGATGQNGTSSNTGTGTSSQGGQGGTVDLRPGAR